MKRLTYLVVVLSVAIVALFVFSRLSTAGSNLPITQSTSATSPIVVGARIADGALHIDNCGTEFPATTHYSETRNGVVVFDATPYGFACSSPPFISNLASYYSANAGSPFVSVWTFYDGIGSSVERSHFTVYGDGSSFSLTPNFAHFLQQGPKLVGTGALGNAFQGQSVSLSADGNTAIVGGVGDNGGIGAAWVFTRNGGAWVQQGPKLVGTGVLGTSSVQGASVSLSADGNTAIVGGWGDEDKGAAWIFTRTGNVWSQQLKLVGTGAVGRSEQGTSVSLSADGNTAIVGGNHDNNNIGAAWVYVRSGGTWIQQGNKLVGSGATGNAGQGFSVSLSANGDTAIVGGIGDNVSAGAAWVFTRSGGVWTQQDKLVGSGAVGSAQQGSSVSLSADGNTALVTGWRDNGDKGAAWVFTRSGGVWTQQGSKFSGSGAVGNAEQGVSGSLSADGNIAILGGRADSSGAGAAWTFTRSGGVWAQQGSKFSGLGYVGTSVRQGQSVALAADGNTAIIGGPSDNGSAGATWIFADFSTDVEIFGTFANGYVTFNTPSPVPWTEKYIYRGSYPNTSNLYSVQYEPQGTSTPGITPGCGQICGANVGDHFWFKFVSGSINYVIEVHKTGPNDFFDWAIDTPLTHQCGSASFEPKTDFGVGGNPPSVVSADFNGDGKLDLAAANSNSNTVSILLGIGTGGFGAKTDFVTGNDPIAVSVGDLNGDGILDLAVANYLGSSVSILLGTGTGSFGAKTDFGTSNGPSSIAVKDFNGDSNLDMAVVNDGSSTVSILLGTGNGGFGANTDFGTGSRPVSVTAGDFNGDGKSDLAIANVFSDTVSVLLGTGTGGFGVKTDYATSSEPDSVTTGDFNEDGSLDLVVSNGNSNNVSILLGSGTGTFGTRTNFPTGIGPYSVAVSDFNGDGNLDLALANLGANTVSILIGTGTGSFGTKTDFGTGVQPRSVTVGDFNIDGAPDLAVANFASDTVSVLLNGCVAIPSALRPAVFSLSPTTPSASPSDQDIFVSGNNFKQGLTVILTAPGGAVTTLSGDQIQNVTHTSFIMRATLSTAGSWSIKVKNPDNQQSVAFPFTVTSGGPAPFITLINPVSPTATGADQYVTVTGGNFQNGLKVNATFPSGGIATFQGTGQIQNVTATSFKLKITLNTEGAWKIRVVNPDNTQSSQFAFTVQPSGPPPTGLPASVLSPVIGPLRITTSNLAIADGKWQFNQHKTGAHTATGGISLSNDTYAWDADLFTATNTNADAGKAVFATAPGQVVSYVGTPPGGGPGAVLIAHPNAAAPVWFSGYMHMTNVRVTLSQVVDSSTLIGEVGRAGATSENLHFVIYSGTNTRGNLQSFNTVINERSSATPPTISSIAPPTVAQGDQLQPITITGLNFAADAILEVELPNGNSFQVTPQTITGFGDGSLIKQIAATSITANVRFAFAGNYKFAVINRSTGARSSGTCPQSCVTVTAVSTLRTPVILIPGIMGSKIARRNGTLVGEELWPATPQSDLHSQLKFDVENPDGPYREISDRPVVASNIVDNISWFGINKDFYANLLVWLISNEGGGHKLYARNFPTFSPCDTSQADKDLFVFPYDWRNSNWTSARDLERFVQCIRSIRGNPPNFKVRIVAHSMGGLVARRYILDHPGTHYVDRMVSLGTPWLGSPRIIQALEDGTLDLKTNLLWINKTTVREIAPFLRGAHELIPAYGYTDVLTGHTLGSFPFGEGSWDFNNNQRPEGDYDFATLKSAMNQYGNSPGTHTDGFHSLDFDDWNRIDTGVDYYNFIGRTNSDTVGSLVARDPIFGPNYLEPVQAFVNGEQILGDGTVPEVSSRRLGINDYRGPRNVERRFRSDHGGLASNGVTFSSIRCVIQALDPASCLGGQSPLAAVVDDPTYNLKVIGSNSVVLADSYGNTSNPLSTSMDEGIDTISTKVSGDSYLSSTIPLNQNYSAVITAPTTTFSIVVLKSDGQTIVQAIRYVDISLPSNVKARIDLSPQGVTTLAYDSDGDGTFDTQVNPTINVTGTQAQDIEPPQLHINETVQGGTSRIDLDATDTGTGVQRIMYSLNGTTFQQYSVPLTLDAATTPTIYAFADDNVFNRSGVASLNLTTSNVGYGVSGPGSAPVGGSAMASWNAPAGRPVDDWIGLFRSGTLNSAYVSKQYTGGSTTGNLSFTLPNEAGTYEFRYLINDGYSSVAASGPITVAANTKAPFDFDGDAKSDISVFRPNGVSGAEWWWMKSSGGNGAVQFGGATDNIVAADYTGDGKTDVAFWRAATGQWFVLRSEDLTFYAFPFGANGDLPVPGDFDGDGKADAAVFRPTTLTWYISKSTGGTDIVGFGASGDKPVVADYDGDGKTDIAVFRPSGAKGAEWWIRRSSNSTVFATQFGSSTDKAVPADYTGDGKADVAFWTPSSGNWFVLRSEDFSYFAFPFGSSTDIPSPGDYDGDGKMDAAVFRPSNSTWYAQRSTAGLLIQQFGATGDVPVPSAFVR